jgi:peptide deformylase
MAILPILKFPDPILTKVSTPVETFDMALKELAQDMAETMLDAPGAGLAAPQVGRLIRLIIIDDSDDDRRGEKTLALVNPVIVNAEGEQIYNEGCLSVDDFQSNVLRYETVDVAFQDLEGLPLSLTASGRKAVVLQHEIDHLDGIMFIDHVNPYKRQLYLKRIQKKQKEAKRA